MKERTPEQLKGQIRKKLWNNYCENNAYASEVSFEDAMETYAGCERFENKKVVKK